MRIFQGSIVTFLGSTR